MSDTALCYLSVPNLTEAEVIQTGLAFKDQLSIQAFHYKQNAGLFIFTCEDEWGIDGGHHYYAGDGSEKVDMIMRYLGRPDSNADGDDYDAFHAGHKASYLGTHYDWEGHWEECPFNVRRAIVFDK